MSNTIRAALEQLLHDLIEGKVLDGAIAAAEQALAEPEGEEPSDEELLAMRSWSSHGHTFDSDLVDFARAALARWGRPVTPPAPETGEQHVSQPYKLPEPGDDPSA